MKRIVDSSLGIIFQSIRENPLRAAAGGYELKRYKWIALIIAGAFTGGAGVLYSMMFGIGSARGHQLGHLGRCSASIALARAREGARPDQEMAHERKKARVPGWS